MQLWRLCRILFDMFYLLALVGTIAYALETVLMSSYYRRVDQLSAVVYRGLALGITMLPLLILVSFQDSAFSLEAIGVVLIACCLSVLANWSAAHALRCLPIGIASTLFMSFSLLVVVVGGAVYFDEVLSYQQLLYIALILLGVALLGLSRSQGLTLQTYNLPQGVLTSVLFGVLIGIAYCLITNIARTTSPLLTGYLWELGIGVVGCGVAVVRGAFGKGSLQKVSKQDFIGILFASSPTAIGTACFTLAITLGPIAVARAVMSTMMVFTTLLAFWFYGEKLSSRQWILMLFLASLLVGLRLADS